MVTNETAVGGYPVEVISVLAETAKEALRYRRVIGACRDLDFPAGTFVLSF